MGPHGWSEVSALTVGYADRIVPRGEQCAGAAYASVQEAPAGSVLLACMAALAVLRAESQAGSV